MAIEAAVCVGVIELAAGANFLRSVAEKHSGGAACITVTAKG